MDDAISTGNPDESLINAESYEIGFKEDKGKFYQETGIKLVSPTEAEYFSPFRVESEGVSTFATDIAVGDYADPMILIFFEFVPQILDMEQEC
jgi:hypothetical protein